MYVYSIYYWKSMNMSKNTYCPESDTFLSYSIKNYNSHILKLQSYSIKKRIYTHTDPVRQRPERGGGRQDHPEADHGAAAGDAVLLPAHQPRQQRRRAAAPGLHDDGAGHPAHQALPHRQDQVGRHGDRPAAPRADHGESQVSGCGKEVVTEKHGLG